MVGLALVATLALVPAGRSSAALGPTFGQPGYLGDVESFAVLAGTQVSNASSGTAPETQISGDVGVYPGTSVTGFPPAVVSNGDVYVAGDPEAFDAAADFLAAYIAIDLLPPTLARPGVGPIELGGTSPVPGVYSADDFLLTNTLTLDGEWDDVWVFQADTLTTATASTVLLTGDANPCNVFWHLDSAATIEVSSDFTGTVLAGTSIEAKNAVSVDGRLLAKAAVTLDQNVISTPLCRTGPTVVPGGGGGGGSGSGGATPSLADTGSEDSARPALVALLLALVGVALVATSSLRSARTRTVSYRA